MCTRLKTRTNIISPGVIAQYRTLSGIKSGKFGVDTFNNTMYNAREDKLTSFWKMYERGVIDVDLFYELGVAFGKPQGYMLVGCLYAPSGSFVIVTTEASSAVAQVHPRMPLVVADEHAWLDKGLAIHSDYIVKKAA